MVKDTGSTNSKCWLHCFLLDWGRIHSVFLSCILAASDNSRHSISYWLLLLLAFLSIPSLTHWLLLTVLGIPPSRYLPCLYILHLPPLWVLSSLMTSLIWLRVYVVIQDVPISSSWLQYLQSFFYQIRISCIHQSWMAAAPLVRI